MTHEEKRILVRREVKREVEEHVRDMMLFDLWGGDFLDEVEIGLPKGIKILPKRNDDISLNEVIEKVTDIVMEGIEIV